MVPELNDFRAGFLGRDLLWRGAFNWTGAPVSRRETPYNGVGDSGNGAGDRGQWVGLLLKVPMVR